MASYDDRTLTTSKLSSLLLLLNVVVHLVDYSTSTADSLRVIDSTCNDDDGTSFKGVFNVWTFATDTKCPRAGTCLLIHPN